MQIFWDQKLVFLATPKTGSSAIEMALEPLASTTIARPPELKHLNFKDFDASLAPILNARADAAFETVALMREPLDWLRSWYRFTLRDLDERDAGDEKPSFEAFLHAYMAGESPIHRHIGRQTDFLTHETTRVSRIFRYEEIERFVHFLEDRLDFAISLPRVNVPPAVNTQIGPAIEAEIRAYLAPDFALYDGVFG